LNRDENNSCKTGVTSKIDMESELTATLKIIIQFNQKYLLK